MENRKIKILAIDDNPDNLISIKALILEAFPNVTVTTALNGKKGIEIATSDDPDVILLDIVMPEMDGFEVCEKLKAGEKTSQIPVIFVTAIKGDKESRIRALEVGAEAFLAKPIDESELAAQIRAMIKIKTAVLEKSNENLRLAKLVEERTREINANYIASVNLFEDLEKENARRIETEKALSESQERYRTLIENANEAIYVIQNGKIVFANQACEDISGVSLNDLLGKSFADFVDKPQKKDVVKQHQEISEGIVQNHNGTFAINTPNGEKVWLSINSVRIIWNDFPASLNFATDITERKQAEDALKLSEEKFREMTDLLPQIVFETDEKNNVTYLNKKAYEITDYTESDLLKGTAQHGFVIPEDYERLFKNFRIKLAGETTNDREYTLLCKDGSTVPVLIYSNVIMRDGKASGIRGVVVDISERKQAEKQIRESEEKYRLLFANNPQPMWIYDLETLAFTEVNQSAIKHYGYSREEFLSMTIKDIRPVEDIPNLLEDVDNIKHEKTNPKSEWRHLKKNGEIIFVELTSVSVISNGRKARHILINDITKRKQAEEKLQENELFLKETQKIARLGSYSFNLTTNFWSSSDVLNEIFGIPADFDKSLEGWTSIIHPDWQKTMLDYFLQDVIGNRTNFDKSYKVIRQNDKAERWVHGIGELQFDNNQQIIRMIGSIQDITDIKMAEEALQKGEMFLRTFIENSPFEIWARDINNIGIIENKKMIDRFGSILGKTSEEFSVKDPKIEELWNKNSKRVYAGETVDDVVEYEADNNILFFNQIIFPIKNKEEIIGIAGFNIDITERKRIESELMETQSLYLSFIEQLPNAVFRKDLEGRYVLVNSHFCKLKGVSKEEFMGATANEVAAKEKLVHADNERSVKYAQSGEDVHKQILKTGKSFESEEEYPTPDGSVIYLHVLKMPVIDSNGAIIGSQGIMFDITERKLIELALNESEEQLKKFASHLQNVREEEKIALAREIHDDLGQILVALKIDMGLLKQKVIKSNVFAGSKDILAKFDNMVILIDNTIKTARRIMNGLRPEQIEMLGFVEATKVYLLDFEERHQLSCQFTHAILELEMSTPQAVALFRIVQEALNNIVKHAKATVIIINLTNPAGKLVLEIIDNGVGFETNKNGRQDSYGLIGMKERVFLLEGELNITSKIGEGTTVKVEMPYGNNQKSL
jgi:PAS domain S-box-containing protein